ncbi:hypothetical protein ACS0TY_014568 [Phlomoides rotata]
MWKKEYGTLSDLLSKSGIGWNSSTNTLDIIDEAVWDAHKRVDTHVKAMGNKSWPYYDRWVDIFGKDHATGEHAIDLIDIVNDMFTNTCEQEGGNGKIGDENSPAKNVVDENTSIAQPSESRIKSSSNKGKKHKTMDHAMSSFVITIGEYIVVTRFMIRWIDVWMWLNDRVKQ